MILEEIIEKLDKSEKNKDDSCVWDLSVFQRELDIYQESVMQDQNNPRLMGYWVANRYCTDSYVGLRAYFFDGKFAAISFQGGRKSDENFEWASEEIAYEIRNYILSLGVTPELKPKIINIKEDLGDGLPVYFTSELLGDTAIYNGKKVMITEKPMRDYLSKSATIQHENGLKEEVLVEHLLMPWKLVE